MKPLSRPTLFMLAFFVLALVWRGAFLPFSRSCYTDGILQIDCFRYGMTYWPPLYALMARLTAWIPGVGLEGGGRFASLLAGALAVWPLGALARRLFGLRAAFWAMAVWVASPMTMRWSLQTMTDMPMAALWTGALAGLLIAVEQVLPGMFPDWESGAGGDPRRGNQWLLLGTMLAALATLTRYQGIFLFPLTALVAWRLTTMRKAFAQPSYHPMLTQLVWLIVPLWVLHGGLGPLLNHEQQIGARAGGQGAVFAIVHVYWLMFESFLSLSPYFVTYGLFGFFLFGLLRCNWATARIRWAGWVAIYLGAAIFAIQSVFSSFQERYLLPLIPLVCLFAGHGIATWERKAGEGSLRFWGLAGPALAFALVFSAMVAVQQGSPFLDIKEAANYIRDEMKLPEGARIVSNETYNEKLSGVKVNFWSGDRTVAPLENTTLKAGDVILISSFNAGGMEPFNEMVQFLLSQNKALQPVHPPFSYASIPLFPDLMPYPYNQNPMAWNLRYETQTFTTLVLQVKDLTGEALKNLPPIEVPMQGAKSQALIEQLKQIRTEIDGTTNTSPGGR